MGDEERTTLTPDEAGAFVAQWAERRKVEVSELAERLGVDDAQTASLLRQSRGRLHMDGWLHEKRPRQASWQIFLSPVLAALVFGGIAGCLIMRYLMPPSDPGASFPRQLPPPPIQISTTEPERDDLPPGHWLRPNHTTPQARALADLAKHGEADSPRFPHWQGYDPDRIAPPSGVTKIVHPVQTPRQSAGIQGLGHDLSNALNTKIPPDLFVEVRTANGSYFIRGKTMQSLSKARALRKQDLEVPTHDLLRAVLNEELKGSDKDLVIGVVSSRVIRVRIRATVGEAGASHFLAWTAYHTAELKDAENPNSSVYRDLLGALLKNINQLGPSLFAGRKAPVLLKG